MASGVRRKHIRTRRRRTKSPSILRVWSYVIAVSLLVFVGAWVFFNIKTRPLEQGVGLTQERLKQSIDRVNKALYGALFEIGVTKDRILSMKSVAQKKGALSWQYVDMEVLLPTGITEAGLKRALTSYLSHEDTKLEFDSKRGDLRVVIVAHGILTHEIAFKNSSNRFFRAPLSTVDTKKKPSADEEKTEVASLSIPPKAPSYKMLPTPLPVPRAKPKIAIIVDDIGGSIDSIERLLNVPAELSFAILPNLPYSEYAARRANEKGRDVILHLPMEPKPSSGYNGANAGDGALLVDLPKEELVNNLERNIRSVPFIKGVNNHMGSRFTENGELMKLVLAELKDKGLFFVDSKTSPSSHGFRVARELGIKTAERDVFLDEANQGQSYVEKQLNKLVEISKKKGVAIGICHPYPQTIEALERVIPRLKNEVDIIPISHAVN